MAKQARKQHFLHLQVLVAKLLRHFEGAEDLDYIATLNKRIGLRCALRSVFHVCCY